MTIHVYFGILLSLRTKMTQSHNNSRGTLKYSLTSKDEGTFFHMASRLLLFSWAEPLAKVLSFLASAYFHALH